MTIEKVTMEGPWLVDGYRVLEGVINVWLHGHAYIELRLRTSDGWCGYYIPAIHERSQEAIGFPMEGSWPTTIAEATAFARALIAQIEESDSMAYVLGSPSMWRPGERPKLPEAA